MHLNARPIPLKGFRLFVFRKNCANLIRIHWGKFCTTLLGKFESPFRGSLCNPFGNVRTALVSEIMGLYLVYKNICSLSPHGGEIAIAHGVMVGLGAEY